MWSLSKAVGDKLDHAVKELQEIEVSPENGATCVKLMRKFVWLRRLNMVLHPYLTVLGFFERKADEFNARQQAALFGEGEDYTLY
jgi:hypothetical protein